MIFSKVSTEMRYILCLPHEKQLGSASGNDSLNYQREELESVVAKHCGKEWFPLCILQLYLEFSLAANLSGSPHYYSRQNKTKQKKAPVEKDSQIKVTHWTNNSN